MMREILFRGKRTDTGEWIEGYYKKGTVIAGYRAAYIADIIMIAPTKPFEDGMAEVEPETVGQYTGMKDKNGRKIFEGDIVQDMNGTTYQVVWGGTGFYLRYDPPYSHGMHYDLLPLCNYWHANGAIVEVIGNIHDNPELLKGGKGDG